MGIPPASTRPSWQINDQYSWPPAAQLPHHHHSLPATASATCASTTAPSQTISGARRPRIESPVSNKSSRAAPTQNALRTLEWISRHENLVVCGPSGTGKTFLLEALGQAAVETGKHVAWFTLEQLGVLVRRHRADDSVTKAITRILRADLVVVDLCRPRDYAEIGGGPVVRAVVRAAFGSAG